MNRITLALIVVAVDFVAFAVPLGSCLIAYILIVRPVWAKQFIDDLYKEP